MIIKKIHSTIALAMALSLLVSCNIQETENVAIIGDSVEAIENVATVAEVTETTEVTEAEQVTEFVYPDLTADTFSTDSLDILHTDFRPSEKLESEIMELINNYGTNCSIYMVNLEDYATFGYNSDAYIATASTIKCPFAYYCYQEIAKGNYSLDDTLQYTSKYTTGGTGVIKNASVGSYYTVKDLLYYMINYSDNIAYLMLKDYFGYEGYNEMLSSNGFETYLSDTVNWGKISSHTLGYFWTEIYKFKDECDEGALFYDTLLNANGNLFQWPFTDAGYDYQIAHKAGWASPGYHDSGIVESEHPFVIVVMTDSEGETRDSSFFYDIVLKFNELHDEYLEYLEQEPSSVTVKATETTTEESTTTEETTTTTEATTTTEETTTTEPTTTTVTTTTTTTPTETIATQPSVETTIVTEQPTETSQNYIPAENTTQQTQDTEYVDPSQNTDQYKHYDDDNLYF